MRTFVLGATGVVGRRAVEKLVAAGHSVTGATRTAEKAELLRKLGATPAMVDLFDAAAIRAAIEGHEAVVDLATNIPPVSKSMSVGSWATNDRIRRDVSRSAVDAALATGARCFVQESITFPYRDGGAEWIREEHPRDFPAVMRSSADAEAQAARFAAGGGRGVALRFAMFVAPDSSHTKSFRQLLRWRIAPVFGSPDGYTSCVHAEDAASAVVAALEAPSGIYNVSEDEPLTRRSLVDAMATRQQCARPFMLPSWLAAANGELVRALMRSQRVSNAKFKAATRWSPRYASAVEGWLAPVEVGDHRVGQAMA